MCHPPQTARHLFNRGRANDGGFGGTGSVVKHAIRHALCIGLALSLPAAAATTSTHKSHKRAKQAPAIPAPAPPAPKVELEPSGDTLPVNPPAISASGSVKMTFQSIAPQDVNLRILALRQTDPAPRIAWGPTKIEQRTLPLARFCVDSSPCILPFTVLHVAAAGAEDLRIEAHNSLTDAPLGAADLRIVREKPPIRAELTGDGVGAEAIVLSLLRTRNFTFHLKNPDNGEAIVPVIGAGLPDCPGLPKHKIMSFLPIDASLEPGAETTVLATVDGCISGRLDRTLRITDQNEAGAEIFARRLIIDPASPVSIFVQWLPSCTICYVLLGAVASIMLNNFFPFQRSRRTLQQYLVQAEAALNDCANLSTGLNDALASQIASCREALSTSSWFAPSKTRLILDVQATITALDATLKVASKLDHYRMTLLSKQDFLSTLSCTIIDARLLDAEDALLAGDLEAAGIAIADAKKRFDAIFADSEQVALRVDLNKRLHEITNELRVLAVPTKPGLDPDIHHIALRLAKATTPLANGAMAGQAQAHDTTAKPAQHSAPDNIAHAAQASPDNMEQTFHAVPDTATVDELLTIERDIFVIETWFSLIETRLRQHRGRFWPFWEHIRRALVMAPKCTKTRMMLGLIRADTTPQEIMESLHNYGARIECANSPYYYITNNYRAILNDPLLTCIQDVRHFIDYTWSFGTAGIVRSRTFQCRYFFKPRRLAVRRDWFVNVSMEVPFADGKVKVPARQVYPRKVRGEWAYTIGEGVSFCVFTLAAIASAYLTKYGSEPVAAVNALPLQDMVTAILYGFGIDQLRDTLTNQASTRLAPAASANTTMQR